MSRRVVSIIGLALVASGVPALGAEGRIPIFAQTTITASGSYIVTQDFTVAAGDGITISASPVTIDLNGHTITMPVGAGIGITLGAGARIVRITNGRVIAGLSGINGAGDGVVVIENVEIDGSSNGIRLTARSVTISSSVIRDASATAVWIDGSDPNTPVTAHVVNNAIVGAATTIILEECRDSEIAGNSITGGPGIFLSTCTGSRIHGNSISQSGVATSEGIRLLPSANNNIIDGNTVRGYGTGIRIESYGNLIRENLTSVSFTGIFVTGTGARNLIDGNQSEGNSGCGLTLFAGSLNAYRNNMLRGNTGGGVCGTLVGNTDAGGNIL